MASDFDTGFEPFNHSNQSYKLISLQTVEMCKPRLESVLMVFDYLFYCFRYDVGFKVNFININFDKYFIKLYPCSKTTIVSEMLILNNLLIIHIIFLIRKI